MHFNWYTSRLFSLWMVVLQHGGDNTLLFHTETIEQWSASFPWRIHPRFHSGAFQHDLSMFTHCGSWSRWRMVRVSSADTVRCVLIVCRRMCVVGVSCVCCWPVISMRELHLSCINWICSLFMKWILNYVVKEPIYKIYLLYIIYFLAASVV